MKCVTGFNIIVVTASNEAQAKGYRAQLAPFRDVLASEIIVEPDPDGKRVGSLGSTVNVLKLHGDRFEGKRVLVCHSGGDSKRLPSYAAMGKAFVPVPQDDGTVKSLFEVIVDNMSRLKLPTAGMLVVCGDVAPTFGFGSCDFSKPGVTGVGYRDSMAEGSRHGVYVAGTRSGLSPVTGFLQKPDAAAARDAGALVRGKVMVDTGILWIDEPTCKKMAKSGWKTGDIYEQFTAELIRGYAPFWVNCVSRCSFFHIGSSRELLMQLGKGREWVDGCEIPRSEMSLAGENIVTGVPKCYGKVRLGKGECLLSLPIGEKAWKHIHYRVDDTFKTDGKWEKFKMAELLPQVNHARMMALRVTDSVLVEKPLRIDLAGGWSDTPPICNELGGCVLNFAATLEGELPVKVRVSRIAQKVVVVESIDLNKRGVLRTDAEIADHADPHDWGCLVKSALTVVDYRLAEGGLSIKICANVPKGSGMGTSSILGAALVEALCKVRNRSCDWREISELTLRLEKEMCTGGGWQDQIGGLINGVKLLVSRPGDPQRIRVRHLEPADEAAFGRFLEKRALLYFTGQKRMARNVLRGVIEFYRQNPSGIAHAIIDRLKRDAAVAYDAVRNQDWTALCSAVNGYWMTKKALDPGSTNVIVESIIARIAPWTSAVSLCGAGGGGFMFIIAHDATAKKRLRQVLSDNPLLEIGRFYDFGLA